MQGWGGTFSNVISLHLIIWTLEKKISEKFKVSNYWIGRF